MVFVLYIWGPAFGLPSIDAECIAATTCLSQLLARDQWTLVVAHDPSQNPNGDFPLLEHESKRIGGYPAIVEYLESRGYSLASSLTLREQAASTAIRAHLTSNALPLLDATLYTSSTNYSSATRPAWTKILPSHANLIVPSRRHAAAKSRTVPLGLSSGSVDDVPPSDYSPQQEQEARLLSSSPSLLFKKRQTLQDALKAQQNRTMFRLEFLTDTLMEPLANTLGGKKYLLSEGLSSIDYLAFGYLALLLSPHIPNAWVADTVRKNFKSMADYVDALQRELLPDGPVDVDAVMQSSVVGNSTENQTTRLNSTASQQTGRLPWTVAPSAPPTSVFKSLSTSLFSSFVNPVQQHFIFDSSILTNSPSTALRSWTSPLTLFLTLSAPIFATISYILYAQTHLDLEPEKRFGRAQNRLHGLGEAGAALSILEGVGPREPGKKNQSVGVNASNTQPRTANVGDILNDTDVQYDGEAKQRREQDQPALSEKPGVSVEVSVNNDQRGNSEKN